MVRTPWFLATLLFASLMLLVMMGPFEVLVPFAIRDRAGGGPMGHALVLTAFGVGGALGSLLISSRPLPRRYLTVMNLLWGLGCVPLVVFGLTTRLEVMVAAAVFTGATFQSGMVIWGTLLQRRGAPAPRRPGSPLGFPGSGGLFPACVGGGRPGWGGAGPAGT